MQINRITVSLIDLEAIINEKIVPLAQAGSILLLSGQLGAGKTTLVKKLMFQIGIIDSISSPTFSYVNSYNNLTSGLVVHHFDLYRLNSLDEFFMQGFDELLQQKNALAIVEWPEILMPFFKQLQGVVSGVYCLNLDHNFIQPETRYLTITTVKLPSK